MLIGEEQNVVLVDLNADGFVQLGRIKNIPEISEDESIETSELPDVHKEWNGEFSLQPPQNHRELRKFIETVHPSMRYVILWMQRYGCNNWRKMHGLPLMQRTKRRKA